jgi:hypothetical protein
MTTRTRPYRTDLENRTKQRLPTGKVASFEGILLAFKWKYQPDYRPGRHSRCEAIATGHLFGERVRSEEAVAAFGPYQRKTP